MTHITREQAGEFSGAPTSHVYTAYLLGGLTGASADVIKERDKIDARAKEMGMCDTCRLALLSWYELSCMIVISRLETEQRVRQEYGPFESPCWAKESA